MKNNAKKRKMYEAFIETLPLLTSLEVSFAPQCQTKGTTDSL